MSPALRLFPPFLPDCLVSCLFIKQCCVYLERPLRKRFSCPPSLSLFPLFRAASLLSPCASACSALVFQIGHHGRDLQSVGLSYSSPTRRSPKTQRFPSLPPFVQRRPLCLFPCFDFDQKKKRFSTLSSRSTMAWGWMSRLL